MTDAPVPMPVAKPASRTRRILFALLKLVVILVILYYVGLALYHQLENVRLSEIHFNPWFMCLAVLVGVAGRVLTSLCYRFVLARLGSPVSVSWSFAMLWVSQLGTYVPGKVASLVGSAWFMGRVGVSAARATKVVCAVTLLSVILGIVISVPLTLWAPVHTQIPQAWICCLVLVVGGLVCLHPRILNFLIHFPMKRMGFAADHEPIRIVDYGLPALMLLGNWFSVGLGVWLAANSVTPTPLSWLPVIVSASALAIVVSFMIFIMPSGLGIREGVFLVVLAPLFGDLTAVVTVAQRLLYFLVDILLAAIGLLIMHFTKLHMLSPSNVNPPPLV